ncbi:ROK family protein [Alkalihalobacillus alcalophilus]|uniref:ROK family protein n=1 Tax=Alkalihalobacillus alcalophilus TaxID=1445 RepID=UPI0010A61A79
MQHHLAGEAGHIIINKSSQEKCTCGNYGCWQVSTSTKSLSLKQKHIQKLEII